jgi:hypothetical protein
MGEPRKDAALNAINSIGHAALFIGDLMDDPALTSNERLRLSKANISFFIAYAAAELFEAAGRRGSLESHARNACEQVLREDYAPQKPALKIVEGGNG